MPNLFRDAAVKGKEICNSCVEQGTMKRLAVISEERMPQVSIYEEAHKLTKLNLLLDRCHLFLIYLIKVE